jgi:uncharacterized membrane protein YhaH (DUF805 family)
LANQKRFQRFTLCRRQFWLFFLAGLSLTTLAPLFNDSVITVAGITLAVVVMALTAAARLRDMGCSAWYTPLVVVPLVALYTGIIAGEEKQQRAVDVKSRLVSTSVFSVALSLSWLVAASAQ